MRSPFRSIIAWLLLACFSLPSFVGQGLHALPGCGHEHSWAGSHPSAEADRTTGGGFTTGRELICGHGACSHGHRSHGHRSRDLRNQDSHVESRWAAASVAELVTGWRIGLVADDHNCLICAFLAISKLNTTAESVVLASDSVFGKHAFVIPGHVPLCISCSPRGPPAALCEFCV